MVLALGVSGSLGRGEGSGATVMVAPWQPEPEPAVQPKQCVAVTIGLRERASRSKSWIVRGRPGARPRLSGGQAQVEHLIEVAVVQPAVPADREGRQAHQPRDGHWVERVDEDLEIAIQFTRSQKVLEEPVDRHVSDRVESGELEAISGSQLASVGGFERGLVGGQFRQGLRTTFSWVLWGFHGKYNRII